MHSRWRRYGCGTTPQSSRSGKPLSCPRCSVSPSIGSYFRRSDAMYALERKGAIFRRALATLAALAPIPDSGKKRALKEKVPPCCPDTHMKRKFLSFVFCSREATRSSGLTLFGTAAPQRRVIRRTPASRLTEIAVMAVEAPCRGLSGADKFISRLKRKAHQGVFCTAARASQVFPN